MAVTPTVHQASGNGGDATSYATGSRTPTADKVQLLFVNVLRSAGSVGTPSVSGCGLTWVQHGTAQSYNSSTYRVAVFRAAGASPTAGALTIDLGGSTHNGCSWVWIELDGSLVGADGVDAIVQSVVGTNAAGTPNLTLSAFGASANATIGFFGGRDNAGTWTVGSGFTSLGAPNGAYPRSLLQFRSDNDTSVDASYSSGGNVGGIAIELAASAAGIQVTALSATFTLPSPSVVVEGEQVTHLVADVLADGWSAAPDEAPVFWDKLDETVPDDADYVLSPAAPGDAQPLEMRFSQLVPPASTVAGGTLRVRLRLE